MKSTPSRFTVGLNTKIIGKCEPEKTSYAGAFKPAKVTMAELAEHIGKGHPWMPGILTDGQRRLQQNIIAAECCAIDIDAGMTIEEALEHPFVKAHAGLLIESSSSKPDHHKFRIVFRIPGHLQDWKSVRLAFIYLIELFGASDPACKDANRFFFGGLGRKALLLNEDARLPASFFDDAKAWETREEEKEQERRAAAAERAKLWVTENGTDQIDEAAEALRFISPYTPGEGRYSSLVAMIGGVINDLGHAGEQLLRGWGEQGQWGKSFDKVLQSVSRSRPARAATIATLFHLAKEGGYRPAKKQRKAAKRISADGSAIRLSKDSSKASADAPTEKLKLTATAGYRKDYGYMPNHTEVLFPAMEKARLIFIGSDCGTGKSRLIEAYLEWLQVDSREEMPIIPFTHRTALGEAQSEMFGVPFKTEINEYGDGLGMALTLDSAHPKSAVRYRGEHTRANSIVVLDEGDQGIDHIVHSRTSIKNVRQEVIEEVCEAMQRSRQVILMSAGLTDRHVSLIRQSVGVSTDECLTIVNTHKRQMGEVWRCYSAAEVWFELNAAIARGEKCLVKLSGADYDSVFSTKTAEAWFEGKRILVLDHDATHDPTNPKAYLEAEKITRGTDGAYACEVIHTESGCKPRLSTQRIVAYISHRDPQIRAERQQRIFAQYDLVIFTNTISSGVSIEHGDFDCFFQIENGAGTIDDLMQSVARYRPPIKRFIFVIGSTNPPHGNGSTDPLKLQAGDDRNWNSQQESIASATADWLPDNDLLVGGNLGQLWRGYCLLSKAERNRQAGDYAEEFFELLREANYQVRDAFIADWVLLGDSGQKAFHKSIKDCRTANAAADDSEVSDRNVEGVELKKLAQKRERTKPERQQIAKLRAMERYGVEADNVSPELIKAEKKGLYQRLSNRYYLEKGLEAAAERDVAKARKVSDRGRTWRDDVLRGAQAYKVRLQQEVGLDKFLSFLRTSGDDGQPVAVHHNSPEVVELLDNLIKHRDALADAFRVKVGEVTTLHLDDGTTKDYTDISRPMEIIKTLLKRLELSLKPTGGTTRVHGRKAKLFSLTDLLETDQGMLIDYERFAELKVKADRILIDEAKNIGHSGSKNEPTGNLVAAIAESPVRVEFQPTGNLVAGNLVAINRVDQATKLPVDSAALYAKAEALASDSGRAAPAEILETAKPDYVVSEKQTEPEYIEIEHPGLYRHGSSLSPWQIISQPNSIGQVWIQGISGVQEVAQLTELAPWRELVPV